MTYGDEEHPHAECREKIGDLQDQVKALTREAEAAAEELERLHSTIVEMRDMLARDLVPQPCGHAVKWLAHRDPLDPSSERYCVLCEVANLRRIAAAVAAGGVTFLPEGFVIVKVAGEIREAARAAGGKYE